ncbi:hypothetical protein PRK78_003196 [Emydomyces testavorans]|uniref:Protein kinase domain-containing protein n=1 Tax=Emydomyces testavorans TaxID=2070801 RepID=A0AAF0DFL7_9EURO|nr:hypothetical protein PRK78_003196 [Emydomyces testavorans]
MASEMHQTGGQTPKVDVWSLFVTMLWILEIQFRRCQFQTAQDAQAAVLFAAANMDIVSKIREMAIIDPDQRASAAQMLVKLYNGEGLSTPWNQVPVLPVSPSRAIVRYRAPAAATPVRRARTAQATRRSVLRHANLFTAAAQSRVQRARHLRQEQAFPWLPELRQRPTRYS